MKAFFLLLLMFYSCSNQEEKDAELNEVLLQNEIYSKELLYFYEDEFYNKREKNPFRIEENLKWQNIGYKIVDKYKEIHNKIDTIGSKFITDSLEQKFKQTILYSRNIILNNIEDPYQIEQTKKDLEIILQKDSINFYRRLSFYKNIEQKPLIIKLIKESLISSNVKLIEYCLSLTPSSTCGYSKHSLIVSSDKEIVSKGQTLTILAGIGELSNKTKPKFFINGEKIEYNQDLIVEKKIKASNKAGTYKVQVKVTEELLDRTTKTSTKTLTYKVVDTICN